MSHRVNDKYDARLSDKSRVAASWPCKALLRYSDKTVLGRVPPLGFPPSTASFVSAIARPTCTSLRTAVTYPSYHGTPVYFYQSIPVKRFTRLIQSTYPKRSSLSLLRVSHSWSRIGIYEPIAPLLFMSYKNYYSFFLFSFRFSSSSWNKEFFVIFFLLLFVFPSFSSSILITATVSYLRDKRIARSEFYIR